MSARPASTITYLRAGSSQRQKEEEAMSVSKLNSMVPAGFGNGEFKFPEIAGKPYGNVADAVAKVAAGMQTAGEIFSKWGKSCLPIAQSPAQKDVAQLDRAEALAQDAFKRVMDPN